MIALARQVSMRDADAVHRTDTLDDSTMAAALTKEDA